jgi:short-subunit dehydrogenase
MNTNKTPAVILTGASSGIGRGIAIALAQRGAKLGLMARRKDELETTARLCREAGAPLVLTEVCDVADIPCQRKALALLDDGLGGATHYVANAGVNVRTSPTKDYSDAAKYIFDINVTGCVAGIEFMKARMLGRRHGVLCGVGSVAATRGLPTAGPYSASKAALHTYLEALAVETYGTGLKICTLAPGYIDTAMTRGAPHAQPFMIPADRAGRLFADVILAGRRFYIAPWQFRFPIFVLKHVPNWMYEMIMGPVTRKMKFERRADHPTHPTPRA